ncbi:UDP-N-acetylmuramoyl-L-alanyl-D-glutamate--2,6-diaminopimelate ligase [Aquibacillus albus]|uniref:UDP-N-acetylmuramyl-tripeptide synthetase n=1 Tax=Aquibacillus albus TaxID=1168171 RepID=A0ABS2MXB8_9BACI|nr:UDP-N-acetylmuramoyl-L-alanyl-D-glutamate--2,6-diaminopimelate ligase [Aquibacillus albus]MBM7570553.1 UDP-N-acetylmuramoyl-L-alanyl-D-glutamate--2,6-diaminopimelate ligase [Aquibacillus albus]
MELLQVLKDIQHECKSLDTLDRLKITGIAESSSSIKEGFLFVAIKGNTFDGHHFIDDAITKGASAIIGEQELSGLSVPYIKVENSRQALGVLAKNYYGNPSKSKVMIAVTGTNGKTTTSYLLKHILEENGLSCSLIGTIQTIVNGESMKSKNTTPSSLTINHLLNKSKDQFVILEASSHGLSQYRLEGMEFDLCLFLNLTHEHLDYHETLENYFETKASLFNKLKRDGKAIINADDIWGRKLVEKLQHEQVQTFSVGQSMDNDYFISKIEPSPNPTIKIEENSKQQTISFPMAGTHNLYNAAMAYAAAQQLSIQTKDIIDSTKTFPGVDGRFEVFPQQNGSNVIVDYAHTADAVFHCLHTARSSGAQRIIHIFGFRGNRDTTKRKEMIQITADLSDQYVLTMDDLNAVPLKEMLHTLESLNSTYGNDKGVIIPDRTLAIEHAVANSKKGDWIIITGKGHEQYQQAFALPTKTDKETVMYFKSLKLK